MSITRKKNTGCLSVLIAFIFAFIMIAAVYYVATESDHECEGEECPVCECIHVCESILHETMDGAAEALIIIFMIIAFERELLRLSGGFPSGTLVSHRVRLND
ncbi:MAG: hypothetical protein K5871_12410 [Lachnospiraceae bacterium]|nr:hypothetical protein [Lachnospiraceae bacterium]